MILATNPTVFHDYEIIESFEAGIALTGPEVKSAKNRRVQLRESYIKINPDSVTYLYNCYIAPYERARQADYIPNSPRKILLRSQEIEHLFQSIQGQNLTIIPIKMYTSRKGLIKLEIALSRGKRKYENKRKQQVIEMKRQIDRTLKRYKE